MCWTIFVLYLHKGSVYFFHHCFTVGRPKWSQRWSVFSFNLHPSARGEQQLVNHRTGTHLKMLLFNLIYVCLFYTPSKMACNLEYSATHLDRMFVLYVMNCN